MGRAACGQRMRVFGYLGDSWMVCVVVWREFRRFLRMGGGCGCMREGGLVDVVDRESELGVVILCI